MPNKLRITLDSNNQVEKVEVDLGEGFKEATPGPCDTHRNEKGDVTLVIGTNDGAAAAEGGCTVVDSRCIQPNRCSAYIWPSGCFYWTC